MLLGGLHVVLLQIALRVRIVAQGAFGDGELARGDGVAAAVAGGVEILVFQRDGELDAVARVGQARAYFDGLARLAASGLEDGHSVSCGREFLEGEAAVLVGESGGSEGMRGAEQGDRRVSFGADASRDFVEDLGGCGGRDENQEAKAQHGNSDCSAAYRVSVIHQWCRRSRFGRHVMKVSAEDFRRQYAGLSDEALLDVDRRDLVEVARTCYDEELARRQLKAPSPAAAARAPEPHEEARGVCRSGDV